MNVVSSSNHSASSSNTQLPSTLMMTSQVVVKGPGGRQMTQGLQKPQKSGQANQVKESLHRMNKIML